MAVIKVNLDHRPLNGEVVTFCAPCDCTAVTGLKIEYPVENGEEIVSESMSFAFRDTHLNDLTGVGNLFLTGAYVKVLVDTTNKVVYFQNADTNAYMETEFAAKCRAKNYLDNSNFAMPINQRGASTYTGGVPAIDRWRGFGGSVITVGEGCVTLAAESETGCIFQRIPSGVLDSSKKYTLAYGTLEGEVFIDNSPVSSGTKYDFVKIETDPGVSLNLVWAALYEGEYTPQNLPKYHPKTYAEELLECQRYLLVVPAFTTILFGNSGKTDGTAGRLFLPTPVVMRGRPTASEITLNVMTSGGSKGSISYVGTNINTGNGVGFYGTFSPSVSESVGHICITAQAAVDITLSAEL